MNMDAVNLVYFSPTHTTQRLLEGIAQGMGVSTVTPIDLTPPHAPHQRIEIDQVTLTLIGAPVHSGRLPKVAVERLYRVQGNNTPAVLVVVYGNRAFEDALLELKDVTMARGFIPIAGAAFIGEHSYSTAALPIAAGRPDAADMEKAIAFGQQIRQKLAQTPLDNLPPPTIPGNFPYKERRPSTETPPTPITIADLCTLCGDCATVCPTAAITVSDAVITQAAACIQCCACTRACPTGARVMEDPRILRTAAWLYEEHSARHEPEIFLEGVIYGYQEPRCGEYPQPLHPRDPSH
ncbi:MAG TPA: 4Fe-4S binding protein [Anaerolineae bacterium]|nr:4Fe-4S binding protein [Anaerolineae bacterium]HQH37539.1 4Fe-4S binding protein [Anaerolineae bacterium]